MKVGDAGQTAVPHRRSVSSICSGDSAGHCDSSSSWFYEVEGEFDYSTKKLTSLFSGSFHPTIDGQTAYELSFLDAGL